MAQQPSSYQDDLDEMLLTAASGPVETTTANHPLAHHDHLIRDDADKRYLTSLDPFELKNELETRQTRYLNRTKKEQPSSSNDSDSHSDSHSDSSSSSTSSSSSSSSFAMRRQLLSAAALMQQPQVNIPPDLLKQAWISRNTLIETLKHPRGASILPYSVVKIRNKMQQYNYYIILKLIPETQPYYCDHTQLKYSLKLLEKANTTRTYKISFVSTTEITDSECQRFSQELNEKQLATPELLRAMRIRVRRGTKLEWTENDLKEYLSNNQEILNKGRGRHAVRTAQISSELLVLSQAISQTTDLLAREELLGRKALLESELFDLQNNLEEDRKAMAATDRLRMRTKRNLSRQLMLEREQADRMIVRESAPDALQDPFARRECRPMVMWEAGKEEVDKEEVGKEADECLDMERECGEILMEAIMAVDAVVVSMLGEKGVGLVGALPGSLLGERGVLEDRVAGSYYGNAKVVKL